MAPNSLREYGNIYVPIYQDGKMHKYVPIYLCIFYMDTYRNVCYNLAMVEKVALYGRPPQEAQSKGGLTMNEQEKKVSAAQRRAADKYLEKFDEMRVRVPKGQKNIIKAHANAMQESLNGFIIRAITETMERDQPAEEATK